MISQKEIFLVFNQNQAAHFSIISKKIKLEEALLIPNPRPPDEYLKYFPGAPNITNKRNDLNESR